MTARRSTNDVLISLWFCTVFVIPRSSWLVGWNVKQSSGFTINLRTFNERLLRNAECASTNLSYATYFCSEDAGLLSFGDDDDELHHVEPSSNMHENERHGNTTPFITHLSHGYHSKTAFRSRRNVFGKDNRIFIPPGTLAQVFPFSAVLRVGRGCTGTLIWKRHILTSAHCVHDGNKFRPPIRQQKVGFLLPDATFKWISVKRAYLPSSWTKKKGLRQLSHDYAVLEIEKPHFRSSMWFGTYDLKINQYVQFAGYPSDKAVNEMWFSFGSIVKLTKSLVMSHCDAMPGMSGSGVYVYEKNRLSVTGSRKIVAIFSSHVILRSMDGKLKVAYNVATRLTRRKMRKICRWIRAGSRCEKIINEQTVPEALLF